MPCVYGPHDLRQAYCADWKDTGSVVALLGMHNWQAISELCPSWPIYQLILSSPSQMLVQILAVDELQVLDMAAAQAGAVRVGQSILYSIQGWCVGAYPSLHP